MFFSVLSFGQRSFFPQRAVVPADQVTGQSANPKWLLKAQSLNHKQDINIISSTARRPSWKIEQEEGKSWKGEEEEEEGKKEEMKTHTFKTTGDDDGHIPWDVP